MRLSVATFVGLLSCALLASPAHAQEEGGFGLDLTGETAPPEDTPPATGGADDVLPRFALVGLETTDRQGASVASRWQASLLRAVGAARQVSLPFNVTQTQERLGEGHDAALRCGEAACMAAPADVLDADLLVNGRLAREGKQWTLRLFTYDRDRGEVEQTVVSGKGPRDAKFLRAATEVLVAHVRTVARPRARLQLNVNVPEAVTHAGARKLGAGSLQARLAAGEVTLTVSAEGYAPFSRTVSLPPGELTPVDVRLEPRRAAPADAAADALKVSSKSSSGTSLLKRPAFYTTLVGLAAVGAGVAMGLQAKSVEERARDANGDGVLDISRREFRDAEKKAQLATLLMAGGGAVAGSSMLWLVLVPARSAAPTSVNVGGASAGASTDIHLFAGGSF
ncbi:PEGA domain-containing protein [Myxococcaceae bacterium GXIMD 01537]